MESHDKNYITDKGGHHFRSSRGIKDIMNKNTVPRRSYYFLNIAVSLFSAMCAKSFNYDFSKQLIHGCTFKKTNQNKALKRYHVSGRLLCRDFEKVIFRRIF